MLPQSHCIINFFSELQNFSSNLLKFKMEKERENGTLDTCCLCLKFNPNRLQNICSKIVFVFLDYNVFYKILLRCRNSFVFYKIALFFLEVYGDLIV